MAQGARESGWQGMAQRRGPLACLLWPLSLLYRALLGLRRAGYRLGLLKSRALPVPVLVVGNLVAGGAGKTPTTLALIEHLRASGWRVGVVSRGHGRREDAVTAVHDDTDPAHSGDEPLLIRRRTGVPVWVGRRRVEAAQALLAAHPEVNLIVCDDGLQHWPLRSDLRIAVFDTRGLGNGWLLPAGLLREPWPPRAGSARAPQLLLCPPDLALAIPAGMARFGVRRSLAAQAVDWQGRARALHDFTGTPCAALAAIARPEAFFGMLAEAGVRPQRLLPLPDHADASDLRQAIAGWQGPVLCTEKDLVKLTGLPATQQAWAVPLRLDIDPGFFAAVDAHLATLRR
jgi:tetraacyldisaccharide 4'-kinase